MSGESIGDREKIIEFLESFRQRKSMYIVSVSPEEAEKFLYGFDFGCAACGVSVDWTTAWERRGWKVLTTVSPILEMREKGLAEEAIIDELISFRQDAIRSAVAANST